MRLRDFLVSRSILQCRTPSTRNRSAPLCSSGYTGVQWMEKSQDLHLEWWAEPQEGGINVAKWWQAPHSNPAKTEHADVVSIRGLLEERLFLRPTTQEP